MSATPIFIGGDESTASSQTGHTITTTVATAAGDDIIAVFQASGSHTYATTASDSAGNSYVVDVQVNQGSSANVAIFRATQPTVALPSGGTITAALASGTSARTGAIAAKVAAGNIATSSPLDQTSSQTGTATNAPKAGTTLALAQANELAISGIAWSFNASSETYTADSADGWTNLDWEFAGSGTNFKGVAFDWQLTSSTAALQNDPSTSTGGWAGVIATYKLASVATPTVRRLAALGVG